MDLKRDEVKYIRDLVKSSYNKGKECYICLATQELQFHHYNSISELWDKFKKNNNVKITSTEEIKIWREIFAEEHQKELYDDTVTLCKYHHMGVLHKLFGPSPSLSTAKKQKNWCEKQRKKNIGE